MTIIITAASWATAVYSALVLVSQIAHTSKMHGWKDPGWWLHITGWLTASLAAFTAAGVFGVVRGAVLTALAAAPAVMLLRRVTRIKAAEPMEDSLLKRVAGTNTGGPAEGGKQLRGTPRALRDIVNAFIVTDFLGLWFYVSRQASRARKQEETPGRQPAPAGPPAPARNVPSFRDDPALGAAPAPQETEVLTEGVPVPDPWMALCQYVAAFEPDDAARLREHMAGEAAGLLAFVEAVKARAENLLSGTGLDPAYVMGHHEYADEAGELAAAVILVEKRFEVIYRHIIDAISENGTVLPFDARKFFGSGEAA